MCCVVYAIGWTLSSDPWSLRIFERDGRLGNRPLRLPQVRSWTRRRGEQQLTKQAPIHKSSNNTNSKSNDYDEREEAGTDDELSLLLELEDDEKASGAKAAKGSIRQRPPLTYCCMFVGSLPNFETDRHNDEKEMDKRTTIVIVQAGAIAITSANGCVGDAANVSAASVTAATSIVAANPAPAVWRVDKQFVTERSMHLSLTYPQPSIVMSIMGRGSGACFQH